MDETALIELERRVTALERHIASEARALRAEIAALRAVPTAAERQPVFKPEPAFTVPETPPVSPVRPAPVQTPPRPPRRPSWYEEIDWASYFTGARGLAIAGGVVSLLGVVFLFVLAVDRGWVTPEMRVAIGAAVSIALFGAATEIMPRYGQLYAATAAVAAAIGGSYATLYAATALYHLVPAWTALLVVAAIASISVALAAVWDSEFVAGLGLVSAIFAPVVDQHEITYVGLLFAAVVFGVSVLLLLARRWRVLTLLSWGSTAVLVLGFLVDDPSAVEGMIIAAVFSLLSLGAASIDQLLRDEERVTPAVVSMAFSSVLVELVAVHEVWGFHGTAAGVAFLLMACACAALAAAWFLRRKGRSMAAVVWALGLVFGGMAAAAVLDGASLTLAWALEAAALFVLATLVHEIRLQVGAAAYALLAAAHGLILDVPPWHLFLYHHHPADGIVGPAALVGALAGGAALLRTRSAGSGTSATRLESLLVRNERRNGEELAWSAGALATYLSVAVILQVAQWLSGTESSFEWAQAVSTGFLTGVGVVIVVLGSQRPSQPRLWIVGLGMVVLALLKLTGYDVKTLGDSQVTLAESLLAALVILGGYVSARIGVNQARNAIYGLMPLSAVVAGKAVVESVGGDTRGYLFAALAAGYATLVATSYVGRRDRNLISLLTVPAAIFATVASAILVQGWPLALVLAVLAAALLLLGRVLDEPRFQLFGIAFTVGVAGLALRFARPDHLLRAVEHPSAGVGAVVAAICLLASAAAVAAVETVRDELDRAYARDLERLRAILGWAAATLTLYGSSLLVLELLQHVGGDSLHTGFQRGETAVSALWAVVGLTLLCLGLFRRRRAARLGGLTLLCVALGKLFLFDLSNLSSLSRALSFLVVGAALLGGGFVYQKLSADLAANGRTT
jgi:uncharacterized membrane protein